MTNYTLDRSVIRIKGEQSTDFLNRIITNTVRAPLSFAALLSPQGKILADFFVHTSPKKPNEYWLESPLAFQEILISQLKRYRLRAPIEIDDMTLSHCVSVAWETDDKDTSTHFISETHATDTRAAILGGRHIISRPHTPQNYHENLQRYNIHRLLANSPDSQFDFGTNSLFPANANMDLLNGVDFQKGCFIGQEVVSRMHRKTQTRKRLCGVHITLSPGTQCPALNSSIVQNDTPVGTLSHTAFYKENMYLGMALMRLDRVEGLQEFSVQGQEISVRPLGGH